MNDLDLRKKNQISNMDEVGIMKNGVEESAQLVEARSNDARNYYQSYKERNSTLFGRLLNGKENKVINRAELDILVTELEAQKAELQTIQEARLKALKKLMESRVIGLNTKLQLELTRDFSRHEIMLIELLNSKDDEFQRIIENFSEKISTYKIAIMQEMAIKNLEIQVNKYYEVKVKLLSEYHALIENQKILID